MSGEKGVEEKKIKGVTIRENEYEEIILCYIL